MDISITPNFCGNRNCIGLEGYIYGKIPPALIVIEDFWDLTEKEILKEIEGLISHETLEFLIIKLEPLLFVDIHKLIGVNTTYYNNKNGLGDIAETL